MQKIMPTGAIARTQLDNARADWLVARARLKNSESALRNARENLGWTRLIAPQSGVITEVSASAGQVVSGGQSVVCLSSPCKLTSHRDFAPKQYPQRCDQR